MPEPSSTVYMVDEYLVHSIDCNTPKQRIDKILGLTTMLYKDKKVRKRYITHLSHYPLLS